jgi:hypothetical protein
MGKRRWHITLFLSEREAFLVRDALDCLNPDNPEAEDIRKKLYADVDSAICWQERKRP